MAENAFCTNCGAPRTPGEAFCTSCGTRYDEQAPDAAATAPLPAAGTPPAPPTPGAPPATKRNRTPLIVGIAGVVVIALVAGLVFVLGGDDAPDEPQVRGGTLSVDQRMVQTVLGDPTFFRLTMAGDETYPGAGRYDSWYYSDDGVRFDFVDGAYAGSVDVPPIPVEASRITLTPDRFRRGMTLQEVTDLVGVEPLASLDDGAFPIEGSELVAFPGLQVGFQDGGLVYVATVPLVEGGTEPVPPLTPVAFHAPAPTRGIPEPFPPEPEVLTAGVLDGVWRLISGLFRAADKADKAKTGLGIADLAVIQGEINRAIAFVEVKLGEVPGRGGLLRDGDATRPRAGPPVPGR